MDEQGTAAEVLVTGAPDRAAEVADALRAEGFAVRVLGDSARAAELAPGSIRCYVQLPGAVPARGGTVIERVRNFLVDGLLARYDAAGAVLPALAPGALLLFVSGHHPEEQGPDNPQARLALLETLAASCILERPEAGLRPLVLQHRTSAREIAAIVREPRSEQAIALAEAVAEEPEKDFAHWRDDVLSMVETYS